MIDPKQPEGALKSAPVSRSDNLVSMFERAVGDSKGNDDLVALFERSVVGEVAQQKRMGEGTPSTEGVERRGVLDAVAGQPSVTPNPVAPAPAAQSIASSPYYDWASEFDAPQSSLDIAPVVAGDYRDRWRRNDSQFATASQSPQQPAPQYPFVESATISTSHPAPAVMGRDATGPAEAPMSDADIARAQNVMALTNVLSKSNPGSDRRAVMDFVRKHMDDATKAVGVRGAPNLREMTEYVFDMALKAGLVSNPIGTVKALAPFISLDWAKAKVSQFATGDPHVQGLSDLLPEETPQSVRDAAYLAEFAATGAASHALAKGVAASPVVRSAVGKIGDVAMQGAYDAVKIERGTELFSDPSVIFIPPEKVREVFNSTGGAEFADVISTLGLRKGAGEFKRALTEGISIVPGKEIVETLTAKPWFAKVARILSDTMEGAPESVSPQQAPASRFDKFIQSLTPDSTKPFVIPTKIEKVKKTPTTYSFGDGKAGAGERAESASSLALPDVARGTPKSERIDPQPPTGDAGAQPEPVAGEVRERLLRALAARLSQRPKAPTPAPVVGEAHQPPPVVPPPPSRVSDAVLAETPAAPPAQEDAQPVLRGEPAPDMPTAPRPQAFVTKSLRPLVKRIETARNEDVLDGVLVYIDEKAGMPDEQREILFDMAEAKRAQLRSRHKPPVSAPTTDVTEAPQPPAAGSMSPPETPATQSSPNDGVRGIVERHALATPSTLPSKKGFAAVEAEASRVKRVLLGALDEASLRGIDKVYFRDLYPTDGTSPAFVTNAIREIITEQARIKGPFAGMPEEDARALSRETGARDAAINGMHFFRIGKDMSGGSWRNVLAKTQEGAQNGAVVGESQKRVLDPDGIARAEGGVRVGATGDQGSPQVVEEVPAAQDGGGAGGVTEDEILSLVPNPGSSVRIADALDRINAQRAKAGRHPVGVNGLQEAVLALFDANRISLDAVHDVPSLTQKDRLAAIRLGTVDKHTIVNISQGATIPAISASGGGEHGAGTQGFERRGAEAQAEADAEPPSGGVRAGHRRPVEAVPQNVVPADDAGRDGEGVLRRAGEVGSGTGEAVLRSAPGSGEAEGVRRPAADEAGRDHQQPEGDGGRGHKEHVAVAEPKRPRNLVITEDIEARIGTGSPKTRVERNIDAIRIIRKMESENRITATPDEQGRLALYVGWGGLPNSFKESVERRGDEPDKDFYSKAHEELKALLTPEEFAAARRSTLNAHYTSIPIIRSMWDVLRHAGVGVHPNIRILEPSMGVGHFFGAMPTDLDAHLHGVEMDSITGKIARALYPGGDIQIKPFQDSELQRNFFDVAIGNVPFASTTIPYSTGGRGGNLKLQLHNFFFARSLRLARPGGLVFYITSTGTMDGNTDAAALRVLLSREADLLLALRLPSNAFSKNAGTSVTTDMLLLRKREEGDVPSSVAWTRSTKRKIEDKNGDFFEPLINEYFIDHPDHVLGKFVRNEMHSADEDRIAVESDGRNLPDAIRDAARRVIEGGVYSESKSARKFVPLANVRIGRASNEQMERQLVLSDGKIARVLDGQLVEVPVSASSRSFVEDSIRLRDAVMSLLDRQREDGAGDKEIAARIKAVDAQYDVFVEKYGELHGRKKTLPWSLLDSDTSFGIFGALQQKNKGTGEFEKSDILKKRVLRPEPEITKVSSAADSLAASMARYAQPVPGYMEKLYGKNMSDIAAELGDRLFFDPKSRKHVVREEYLSGNVVRKLRDAVDAAGEDSQFERNVVALRGVQPKAIPLAQISISMGAPWIPEGTVHDFVAERTRLPLATVRNSVRYIPELGKWVVDDKGWSYEAHRALAAFYDYGNPKNPQVVRDSQEVLLAALNPGTSVNVTMENEDGATVLDPQATMAAKAAVDRLQDEFAAWTRGRPQAVRDALEAAFNETQNVNVEREWSGDFLRFDGKTRAIDLKPWQSRAAFRAMCSNTLIGHFVGAGKTFSMIAAAMEGRRLGTFRKPMMVIKPNMVSQFVADIYRLYPASKVMVLTSDNLPAMPKALPDDAGDDARAARDLVMTRRAGEINRIATNDWDVVVVSHSMLSRLPLSMETRTRYIREETDTLELTIRAAKEERGAKDPSVKELEKAKDRAEKRLVALLKDEAKDRSLSFEQLGVDAIFVDEAHNFKNLHIHTALQNVAAVQGRGAQKSEDLFFKTKFLHEKGGRVVFATATPVSNTLSEMYNMMRYVCPDILEESGTALFDRWVATYARVVPVIEVSPNGTRKMVDTLARFSNLTALARTFRAFGDFLDGNELDDSKPRLVGGAPQVVQVEGEPWADEFLDWMSERINSLKGGRVDPSDDNMLLCMTDARKLSVTASKISACVERAAKIYVDSSKTKGSQVIFLDLGKGRNANNESFFEADRDADDESVTDTETSGKRSVPAGLRGAFDLAANAYAHIKEGLIARGVNADEIAFADEPANDKQKKKLLDDLNSGHIRVVIGSTAKLGEGANFQERLVAEHDLDVPWKPAHIAQRMGRILRQGNGNKEVHVIRYVVKGTFDEGMWNKNVRKLEAIQSLLRRNNKDFVEDMEDVGSDVLSYQEAAALASGDPLELEFIELDRDIQKLQLARKAHEDRHASTMARIGTLHDTIERRVALADAWRAVGGVVQKNVEQNDGRLAVDVIGETRYVLDGDEKGNSAALKAIRNEAARLPYGAHVVVGDIGGLDVVVARSNDGYWIGVVPRANGGGRVDLAGFSFSSPANIQLHPTVKELTKAASRLSESTRRATDAVSELEHLRQQEYGAFPDDKKLAELTARMEEIRPRLDESRRAREADRAARVEWRRAHGNAVALGEPLSSVVNRQAESANEGLPAAPSAGLGIGLVSRAPLAGAPHAFDLKSVFPDDETRSRIEQARGPLPTRNELWAATKEFFHNFKSSLPDVPNEGRYAKFRSIMGTLSANVHNAGNMAAQTLANNLSRMTQEQYDAFSTKRLLDDLTWTIEDNPEAKLPFGLDREKLSHALSEVDAYVATDSVVSDAVRNEEELTRAIGEEMASLADELGYPSFGTGFRNPHYFRHVVLDYATAEHVSGGLPQAAKGPDRRGYLRRRHGSEKDISANYIHAMFSVRREMLADSAVMKALVRVKDAYDIRRALQEDANKENNRAFYAALLERFGNQAEVEKHIGSLGKKQARALGVFAKLAADDALPLGQNCEYESVVEALANSWDDLKKRADLSKWTDVDWKKFFSYAAYLLQPVSAAPKQASGAAALMMKGIAEKKAEIKATLGDAFLDWRAMIPEGHTTFHPWDSGIVFSAQSIPEYLLADAMRKGLSVVGVPLEKVRTVRANGGPRQVWVVPEPIASTLEKWREPHPRSPLARIARHLTNAWKAWILLNPSKLAGYNFRNLISDADAVVQAGAPGVFRYVGEAFSELFPVYFQEKASTGDLLKWEQLGGDTHFQTISDFDDIDQIKALKRLSSRRDGLVAMGVRGAAAYFDHARRITGFREAILRYAAFKYWMDEIRENGEVRNFGPVSREMVEGLGAEAAAYLISNAAIGDFAGVSKSTRELSRVAIPFANWSEVNIKRIFGLARNAFRDGTLAVQVGRTAFGMFVRSPLLLIRLGKMLLWGAAFSAMVDLWNRWRLDDDYESVAEMNNGSNFLVLDRDGDDNWLIRNATAMSSFLSTFGLESAAQDAWDIYSGRKTLGEMAQHIAAAPANVLVQGLNPMIRMPLELLTGKSLYPSILNPQEIRDNGQWVANSFGLGRPFAAFTGRPQRDGDMLNMDVARGALASKVNLAEAAYYHISNRVRQFNEKKYGTSGSTRSNRSDEMGQWMRSIKLNDRDAASRYLTRFALTIQSEVANGTVGERERMALMQQMAEGQLPAYIATAMMRKIMDAVPLSGLKEQDMEPFLSTLSAVEREKLLPLARQYYGSIVRGVRQQYGAKAQ